MAQESKRKYFVHNPGAPEFVTIEVAPGETTQDVLEATGARGALGLSIGQRNGLVFLRPAAVGFASGQTSRPVMVWVPGVPRLHCVLSENIGRTFTHP